MSEYVSISPQARAILDNLKNAPAKCLEPMAKAMDRENVLTVSHIQRDYLSFSRSGPSNPDGLRVQSGSLRRSLRASKATLGPTGLTSGIGGNVTSRGVNYLAVHEFGAEIPEHTITATNARALHFFVGGKEIFRKSVKIPAITLPARGMIARGIQDRLANYGKAMSDAVVKTFGGN